MFKIILIMIVFLKINLINAEVPNIFAPGDVVSSSKVNENFASLANMIMNDNITAMMICEGMGIKLGDEVYGQGGDLFFFRCNSTNNQTFEEIDGCSINFNYNSFFCRNHYGNFENFKYAITLKNIFLKKWLLYSNIVTGFGVGDSGYRQINHKYFYKVGND